MSSQVIRLVLVKTNTNDPLFTDTMSKMVEIDLPENWTAAYLLAARAYEPKDTTNTMPGGDINATILRFSDESDILGKMLTLADMSFSDKDQREAFKSVARNTIYDFFNHMRNNAIKCVDAQEREERRKDVGKTADSQSSDKAGSGQHIIR